MTVNAIRAPRIVIASRNGSGQTGSVNKILDHARRFTAIGWDVSLVAENADPATLARDGVRFHAIRESWWPWARPKRRVFRQRAEAWIATQAFDLVVAHGDLLQQDVLHVHNCVHLAHERLHGVPMPAGNPLGQHHRELITGGRFKVLIANGDLMKQDLVRRFSVPADRIQVIHPGHDPERFRRQDRARLAGPLRAKLGFPENRLVIGFITSGNFHKRGLDVLIAAFAGLGSEVRARCSLLIVGGDSAINEYRKSAAAAGIGDQFVVVGRQTRVEEYHHACDLYVLPARFEEFGQAAQEAMVCGVPSIISDQVGVVERLPAQAREGVVPAGEVEALRSTLARFIAEPALQLAWAETGHAACVGNTWQANWSAHVPVYEGLIKTVGQP